MKKRIYAPWRHDYVNSTTPLNKDSYINNCVFCHQFAQQGKDEEFFILKRFPLTAVMLNFYPYNAGHLMVLPLEHQGELLDLPSATRAELMEVTAKSLPLLKEGLNAQGFNIGINLGHAGGGGIPEHLHIHILPRWRGDTNFLEAIGGVKIISSDLHKIYKTLKDSFSTLTL